MSLHEQAKEWCQEDRGVAGRALLLAYGVFVLLKILRNDGMFTPIDFLDLGIHELGHIVAMPFGEWIGIAGGSIAQLIAPIYGIWQFERQGDFFAAAFGLGWLGESLFNLSQYIGDARAQNLPLANLFGGDPIHDWNYLLSHAHMLGNDWKLALIVRGLALVSELAFLYFGGWLVWQIILTRRVYKK